jgi:hypothetical protein
VKTWHKLHGYVRDKSVDGSCCETEQKYHVFFTNNAKHSLDPNFQTHSIHPTYLRNPQIRCWWQKMVSNFTIVQVAYNSAVSYCKVYTFSLISFHMGSSHSTPTLLLHHNHSTLLSHKSLGFLLLSILIRCPNHLSSLLSNISVAGTLFSILQISLFLILSLLVCSNSSLAGNSVFTV